jgi:hypothetical protein
MIRKKSTPNSGRIIIDLTGPEGNAFVLMGLATDFANQLKIDPKPIIEEMKSSDYENLIQVFDRHFGNWVILER